LQKFAHARGRTPTTIIFESGHRLGGLENPKFDVYSRPIETYLDDLLG